MAGVVVRTRVLIAIGCSFAPLEVGMRTFGFRTSAVAG